MKTKKISNSYFFWAFIILSILNINVFAQNSAIVAPVETETPVSRDASVSAEVPVNAEASVNSEATVNAETPVNAEAADIFAGTEALVSIEAKVDPPNPAARTQAHVRIMLKSASPDIRVVSTPSIEPDGASVTSVGALTRTIADMRGSRTYVKEFLYKIFVKRPGKINIPSITIEYEQNKLKGVITSPAIVFIAAEPPRPWISVSFLLYIFAGLAVCFILACFVKKRTRKKALEKEKIENETKEELEFEKTLENSLARADKLMSSGDAKAAFNSCARAFDLLFRRKYGFAFELNSLDSTRQNIESIQMSMNDQQDLFALLEAFYNARYAGLADASEESASIVRNSRKMIKKLKEISENNFLCPQCGKMVDKNASACPDCGAEFEKEI